MDENKRSSTNRITRPNHKFVTCAASAIKFCVALLAMEEEAKTEFIAMLKEKSIDRHARWADVKKKVDSEPQYKAVDSSTLKETYFREYCKLMKEERKKEKDTKEKEKDRERSSKKDKKDKDRDKEKEKDSKKKKDKGEVSDSRYF
ncbi:hypothetical protein ACJJTC_010816 [Scirpophaga incertulas]